MKIAVMSDFHFGFGAGTELEQDSYEAVGQALEASRDCDLILMPGDLFDTRVPGTEALAKAMQLMIKPSLSPNGAKFVKFIGKDGDGITPRHLSGIPMVTIHGTHERRTKELMNPVQALEKAGFAIHLHCNGVVFEKNGEKVAVFGFSGVPENQALETLREWNPRPESGCYNIFMLHQNIREFMYEKIEHAIKTDELPDGFDLYLCGHIHESRKAKKGGRPFLLPGSLIPTQMNKESLSPRGFFIVDTRSGAIDFAELERQRRVFIIEEGSREKVEREMEKALSGKHYKMPIIRVKLPADADPSLANLLRHKYEDRAVLSVRQEAKEETDEAERAKTLEEHVLSVQELGRKLLQQNLADAKLSPHLYESVFELIADGREEEAERLLLNPDVGNLGGGMPGTKEKADAKAGGKHAHSVGDGVSVKSADIIVEPKKTARKPKAGNLFSFA
jgi:DNA repair exonuclease SbcCD nuclease subunit